MQFLHLIYKCDVFVGRSEKSFKAKEVAYTGNYVGL